MKNGGKNKSVAFIIFVQCIYTYIYIYIYIYTPATLLGTPVQLLGNTNC